MPGIAIEEQETCINFMRDQDFAIEYTSDSTEITLMDKRLCLMDMRIWAFTWSCTWRILVTSRCRNP